jgi:hypothetical protein
MTVKDTVFWIVRLCRSLRIHREDGGDMFIRDFYGLLLNYTVMQPRGSYFS